MGQTFRSIWKLLALAGVLALLVAVPAIGQDGDGFDPPEGETIRLHLGTDGKFFQHQDAEGTVLETQDLPEPVRCELRFTGEEPLASLSGSNQGPGIFDLSIGIKRGPQGVPCGRVETGQNLTLTLGTGFFAHTASFDLELKGSVEAELRLNTGEAFTVRSGSRIAEGEGVDSSDLPHKVTVDSTDPIANCTGRADSGPDAGERDNCYVTIIASQPFNTVTFAPSSGEVSLEGSGDFGNDPAFDTIFFLENWDGELNCGDTVGTDPTEDVVIEVTRLDNLSLGDCVAKLFRISANAEDASSPTGHSATFELSEDMQEAAYKATITFPGEFSNPTDAELQWSTEPPFESFEPMVVCIDEPFAGNTINTDAIPEGEEGCIYSVSQDWTGRTVWEIIFTADPRWV